MMFENVDGWTSPCHVHIASHSVQALLEAFFHFFFKYKNAVLMVKPNKKGLKILGRIDRLTYYFEMFYLEKNVYI